MIQWNSLYIGKEMSMRRLGVPEWLIMDIVYSLDKAAQVSVLTAHGLSDPYHPETGWPQGNEECLLWFP